MSVTDLGPCAHHPDEAAAFRCRQCLDAQCRECRAPGERDLCRSCQEYFERLEAAERLGPVAEAEASRPRPAVAAGILIAVLLAVNALLTGVTLLVGGPPIPAEVRESAAALADIASAVEAARDAQGRAPASLEPLLDRLSPRAAELARGGRIEYEPGEGRGDYEVALPLGAAR